MSDSFVSLSADDLDRFLQRTKASAALPDRLDMSGQLQQILERATQLVPSEAGAILLDDPLRKGRARDDGELFFVAAFGPAASQILGDGIPAGEGIAGKVYREGQSHLSADVREDTAFAERFDEATGYATHSIVAAPIVIGGAVCGTIELLNRKDGRPYDDRDLALLEVFASYTSSSLQNALDATQAQELAKRDDLTGLFNDRLLHAALREELRRADERSSTCGLVFIDLDNFKPINDTHGHLVGSQVLRELGYLLRRVTADQDAVLARYGGDEFAIILPGASRPEAVELANRVRQAINEAVFLTREHGPELPALHLSGIVSASVGVEVYQAGASGSIDERARELMHRADAAMYAAKHGGKNRLVAAWEMGEEQQLSAFE